ncbi:lipase 3-like [Ostrinia furnacalis]|uniref:lipase 3-like n=1 Tax=Ostrinia furnacalis TaxID=93504 RepID=UPI00103CA747|nr:lipase 3-like [Ostrinia furnacalis]
MSNSFDGLFSKVKNIFVPRVRDAQKSIEQYILEERIKQAFNDFVEKTAADADTESPEYASMKSEPTALMSTPQLATIHGRRIESHVIKTRDGYLLTLHRILSKHNQNDTKFSNETILLHHGLLGSSADWILLGPEKSLPYILSDAGYDVWMTNARGNYYSRGHKSKPVNSRSYWRFTFQEMGEYDLPAAIDYVRTLKNSTKKINYVGHSMGATALLVLLSTAPRYNQYLRIGILLAPLAFMSNIQGPLKILTSMSTDPPDQLLKAIGDTEFVPSRKIPKMMASKFCKGANIYCSNPLLFLTGSIPEQEPQDASFMARLLYHVPAGGSTDTIMHYGQLVKSGKFHRFGRVKSEFPLNQVKLPIAMFSSSTDWLATVPDVLRLYFSISNPIDHYVIRGQNLSHTEFVWGSEANVLVFPKLMDYLENGLNVNFVKANEV